MQKNIFGIIFLCLVLVVFSCKSKNNEAETPAGEAMVQTPVTVVPIARAPLRDYAELNATSTFLQNNIIKASSNGYIKSINISPGQLVASGKELFTIQTKEAKNIGTIIDKLDTSFRFSGVSNIKASQSGYITQINHQLGDYVQDGEQLAVISTENSFGFLLNVPYELKRYVFINKQVDMQLPDGTHIAGRIKSIMPMMDSVSQTQRVLIVANPGAPVPENLIVKVKILKTQKDNVVVLPKEAILSDESQTNFWVMKMIDSVTAIKIAVTKGMEMDGKIEILQPDFKIGDQIVISGNYGLPDTAKVKIVKLQE